MQDIAQNSKRGFNPLTPTTLTRLSFFRSNCSPFRINRGTVLHVLPSFTYSSKIGTNSLLNLPSGVYSQTRLEMSIGFSRPVPDRILCRPSRAVPRDIIYYSLLLAARKNINKNEFLQEQTPNKNDLIIAKSISFT